MKGTTMNNCRKCRGDYLLSKTSHRDTCGICSSLKGVRHIDEYYVDAVKRIDAEIARGY